MDVFHQVVGTQVIRVEGSGGSHTVHKDLEQVRLHWPEGVPAAEFMPQLRLFARDVMPAFGGS